MTYHLYVSHNVSTVQFKVWTHSRGICCHRFCTSNSQLPQVHWLRVQFLQTTTDFVPNMFDWVHIRTIGGPIHADDVLLLEVSIQYTSPMGSDIYHQPVSNGCKPCPAMWNQVFLQNSAIDGSSDILIQNAQGGFPI